MRHLSKIFTLALYLLSFHTATHGWEISKAAHQPRIGDELNIDMYEGIAPDPDSKNCIWDFSGAVSRGETQLVAVSGVDDRLLTIRYPRHRMYYGTAGDTLLWHGYETRRTLMTDTTGILSMCYPIAPGDSCMGDFKFEGKYTLTRPASNQGKVMLKADGPGTLILPDGDTISNVIRVCREYRGVPRVGPAALTPISPDSSGFSILIYREYDWYARGYRYPLFSLRQAKELSEEGAEVDYGESFAWSCTRHTQEIELAYDPENEKERVITDRREFESHGAKTGNENEGNAPFEQLQIKDNGSTLTIEFENTHAGGWLELIVSDSNGIPYITMPRRALSGGHNTVTVDLSRLPSGEYALLLINGEARLSQTFTHR